MEVMEVMNEASVELEVCLKWKWDVIFLFCSMGCLSNFMSSLRLI